MFDLESVLVYFNCLSLIFGFAKVTRLKEHCFWFYTVIVATFRSKQQHAYMIMRYTVIDEQIFESKAEAFVIRR